jgi:hypothetical protein
VKLRIFTVVHGERYLHYLKGLVTSLSWPENRKALEGAHWVLVGDEKAVGILETLGIPAEYRPYTTDALFTQVQECADNGLALLAANPDFIFGEGTVKTLVRIASEGEGICVSFPHPRVTDDFPIPETPTSNARLVKLAMANLHHSWKNCQVELTENSSYWGGVAWRDLGEGLYGVSCRLPTPFLVRPIKGDVEKMRERTGGWDHCWPEKMVNEQRHRIIAGSDAAFVVERTSSEIPRLKVTPRNTPPDEYRFDRAHHRVNRNTISIWRAE